MSKVAVNRGILNWAIERSGVPFENLQNKFPKIGEWITGEAQPTLRQLELLAKATLTPFGFFFLSKPPIESLAIPYFRTLDREPMDRPSPDLLETVQMMQRRQAWMRDFLIEQGHEKLSFVRSVGKNEQPELVARRMRGILGFKEGWASQHKTWTDALRDLREAMEETAGILVVVNGIVSNNTHRKLDPGEFRGFVLVDEYAPLVFVNGADFKAAQMFTLAHELAHLFFGSSAAFDLREMLPANDPVEKACNRVAAEFLVPGQELHKFWPYARNNQEPFQTIAHHFKVSAIVAARRALDTGLIQKATFLKFYYEYRDKERVAASKSKGGDFYLNQSLRLGPRFAFEVIRAAKEGRLLYSEAYHLTSLYGRTFDRYSSHLGFGG